MLRAFLALLLLPTPVLAWNGLGHKVVAEIAWQELSPTERQPIIDALRRHPAFDKDFAGKMEDDVATADKDTQDHWIFLQAATWPDITRKSEYDRPSWHYIDVPLFLDGKRRVPFNLSIEYPTKIDTKDYNVAQATKHCLAVIADHDAGLDSKALAYSWLLHLVADMHQPLHTTSLVCDYFPKGDEGGNKIPIVQGKNLHSLWDNLLGRQSRIRDVQRIVTELKQNDWKIDTKLDIDGWIAESHKIAETMTYDPIILQAVREATPGMKLAPFSLQESYLKEAGRIARQRIVMAGLRLANLLSSE